MKPIMLVEDFKVSEMIVAIRQNNVGLVDFMVNNYHLDNADVGIVVCKKNFVTRDISLIKRKFKELCEDKGFRLPLLLEKARNIVSV